MAKQEFLLHFIPKTLIDKLDFTPDLTTESPIILFRDTKLKKSYLIDIVHNLLLKYYFKRFNDFCLYSLILKEKYGKFYNLYLDWLIENEVILLLRNYCIGKGSRHYRLNTDIFNNPINRYRNHDKILIKKFVTKSKQIETKDVIGNIIEHDIKKKLVQDLYSVNIRFDESINYLKLCNLRTDVYERNLYSVEAIKSKHIFYHFDDYGRMHTNFTILKTFIRKHYLTIDNEPVFEIDISNSQPRFLVLLIENCKPIINKTEFELFKYLVNNGVYYQYLMDNMGIDKKAAKKATYKILFGRNRMGSKPNYDSKFNNLFPTIHKFIRDYKTQCGDYRVLSHTLQKMESNLIFNSICKEAYSTSNSIKLVTIHDSIICQLSHKNILTNIFNRYIDNLFKGMIKKEKIEYQTEEIEYI